MKLQELLDSFDGRPELNNLIREFFTELGVGEEDEIHRNTQFRTKVKLGMGWAVRQTDEKLSVGGLMARFAGNPFLLFR